MNKSRLIKCDPYLVKGNHYKSGEYWVYVLTFEDGTQGNKRSTKSSNPYELNIEYEYETEQNGKYTNIKILKKAFSDKSFNEKSRYKNDPVKEKKIHYNGMMDKAVALCIHNEEKFDVQKVHEVCLEMLQKMNEYAESN